MNEPAADATTHAGRPAAPPTIAPPAARREDIVEELHGHRVADPYRWLEGPSDDPPIATWVRAQAESAQQYLTALPTRAWFRSRLGDLWNHPRRGAPWRRGDRWFQLANDGSQDQDVLYTAPAAQGPRARVPDAEAWSVLLDPTTWTHDGTAALTGLSVTESGTRAAFARSDAGSDWMVWRVLDTVTGELLDDEVPWSKFSTAAWLPDEAGFLYSAYTPPADGTTHAAINRDQQLRLHRLGTDAADDEIVHARPDQPEWGFLPTVSSDGRWLILTVTHGTDPNTRIAVAPIENSEVGVIRLLLDDGDAHYRPLGVLGDELVVMTDADAPRGRVVAVGLGDPGTPREIVGEGGDRLEDARLVGGAAPGDPAWLVLHTLHHATSRVTVHDLREGSSPIEVQLPGPGTVKAITGGREDTSVHLTLETFTAPSAVHRVDLADPAASIEIAAPSTPPADDLVVQQVLIHHDGVAVPLFLISRRDLVPDGTVPTVLWGYGGFDIAVTPLYRPGWRAWVDAGGLLAVACLRGGGEYGRSWHDAGRRAHKEQVFDDALACAAWLTGRRGDDIDVSPLTDSADVAAVWSAPEHLGIEGRSNGGLLAAACMTREPQAFGSVVPEVGVLDMVRFHRFTIGWAWTSDYGSPDDPDDLAILLRYSPYHRVDPGRSYPATLITTGDTDDRVVPAHSYKFAAALQHAQGGPAPVLLRVDIAAGHGAGKPVGKLLDERADVLAFHAQHLGLAVPDDTTPLGGS